MVKCASATETEVVVSTSTGTYATCPPNLILNQPLKTSEIPLFVHTFNLSYHLYIIEFVPDGKPDNVSVLQLEIVLSIICNHEKMIPKEDACCPDLELFFRAFLKGLHQQ